MTVQEIPTEDLEGQLMSHCTSLINYLEGDPLTVVKATDAAWMRQAIKELQLRRLAGSAP